MNFILNMPIDVFKNRFSFKLMDPVLELMNFVLKMIILCMKTGMLGVWNISYLNLLV